MTAVTHGEADRMLGEFVELHHDFAMNIHIIRFAENLHKTRFVDFTGNDLCRDDQAGEESCEIPRRAWVQPLFVEYVLLNRPDLTHASQPPLLSCGIVLTSHGRHKFLW